MQLEREARVLLQRGEQLRRVLGEKHARHILYAERVRSQRFDLFRKADEIIDGMDGRRRIAQRYLTASAVFLRGDDRLLQVADVVQRVENADDVDTVFDGLFAEQIDDVVGIVAVAQYVLPSEKHLQLRVLTDGADFAKPFPRILV